MCDSKFKHLDVTNIQCILYDLFYTVYRMYSLESLVASNIKKSVDYFFKILSLTKTHTSLSLYSLILRIPKMSFLFKKALKRERGYFFYQTQTIKRILILKDIV